MSNLNSHIYMIHQEGRKGKGEGEEGGLAREGGKKGRKEGRKQEGEGGRGRERERGRERGREGGREGGEKKGKEGGRGGLAGNPLTLKEKRSHTVEIEEN